MPTKQGIKKSLISQHSFYPLLISLHLSDTVGGARKLLYTLRSAFFFLFHCFILPIMDPTMSLTREEGFL